MPSEKGELYKTNANENSCKALEKAPLTTKTGFIYVTYITLKTPEKANWTKNTKMQLCLQVLAGVHLHIR